MLLSFFQCHVHHRDLHSFPTRRSSDLDRECSGRSVDWQEYFSDPEEFRSLQRETEDIACDSNQDACTSADHSAPHEGSTTGGEIVPSHRHAEEPRQY